MDGETTLIPRLGLLFFGLLVGLAACTSAATPTPNPEATVPALVATQAPAQPTPTATAPKAATTSEPTPTLLPVVKLQLGFAVGDSAIDFRLKDLNGTEVTLYESLAGKPVMLQFGSYT